MDKYLKRMTEEQAKSKGMSCEHDEESITKSCPECKCIWYGNKNHLGEGYRMCLECHQDYWINIDYAPH